MSRSEGPPLLYREAIAADYLRAALAYMLISMPHGTSTILGAFQAILALLAKGSISAFATKLSRSRKFASEIFCKEVGQFCCDATSDLARAIKSKRDQRLRRAPCGVSSLSGRALRSE